MRTFKFPDSAVSTGVARYYKTIPFNRELCRLVQWWEKQTGNKFCRKILSHKKSTHFDNQNFNIYLNVSEPRFLLHELQHWLQKGRGFPLGKSTWNWFRLYNANKVTYESYWTRQEEKEANKASSLLWKKFSQSN